MLIAKYVNKNVLIKRAWPLPSSKRWLFYKDDNSVAYFATGVKINATAIRLESEHIRNLLMQCNTQCQAAKYFIKREKIHNSIRLNYRATCKAQRKHTYAQMQYAKLMR